MNTYSLTSLRFVAALIVVIFHFGKDSSIAKLAPGFLTSGPEMVTFFFVLSGFVMVVAYYQKPKFSTKKYWIARCARILPIYLIALIFSCYFLFIAGNINITALFLNLALLQAWIPPYPLTLNSPGWSLSVEAFFYLCFPFILKYIKTEKQSALFLLLASLFFWLITQVILSIVRNSGFYQGFPSPSHDLIYYFPLSHFCSFLLGVTGAYYFLKKGKETRINYFFSLFLIIFIFLSIFLILENKIFINNALGINLPMSSSFLAPLFLCLIYVITKSTNLITWILDRKPFVILGQASYSLYILQLPFHVFFKKKISPSLGLDYEYEFYIYLILLITISIFSYYLLEKPAKNIILNVYSKYMLNRSSNMLQQSR